MKRYRVFAFDWNSIGDSLILEINEEWDEDVKALHRQHREQDIQWLTKQYGEWAIEEKLESLRAIGGQAFSIVAYHNRFYKQARDAFIVGAYYPALTAACALGERILNHLILGLRDDYKGKPGHNEFATAKTFWNWKAMILTLEMWGVLLPAAATEFRALMDARHRAIHFNPATAEKDREFAIEALKHLDEIIAVQFGAFRLQPWFIPDVAGAAYIRKDWETDPFVKLVYLPASWPVGPYHWMEFNEGQWTIHDRDDYEDRDVTDEEFAQLQDKSAKAKIDALPDEDVSEPVSVNRSGRMNTRSTLPEMARGGPSTLPEGPPRAAKVGDSGNG